MEPSGQTMVTNAGVALEAMPRPHGVNDIEMRTLVAYGLILLMATAAVAAIFYWRHNSHDRKILRQREREDARREERARNP